MEIRCGNIWSALSGHIPYGVVERVTSYMVPNHWFSDAWKKGHWDGRKRYARKQRDGSLVVPTGFLSRITRELDREEWPYKLYDDRVFDTPESNCYELYDQIRGSLRLDLGRYAYQGDAVDRAITAGRGIIKIATGGGKTEIAAAIIKSLGVPSIWLTHRRVLAEQTQRRLSERLQQPVAIFGDTLRQINTGGVTVMMVQSAAEALKQHDSQVLQLFDNVQLIIGDEVHHLESDSWYAVFSKVKAPWRFGLTATPRMTGAGLSLLAMTEDLIVDINAWELIERLVLVPPRIWWVQITEPELDEKIPWQTAYKLGIVSSEYRNGWITMVSDQFRQESKPTLTLVLRLNHGEKLKGAFRKRGIRTKFLHGKHSQSEREDALGELVSGRLDNIIGQVSIFGEGTDVPDLRAIINATGTRGGGDASEDDEAGRLTKQVLGRGLRRAPGKHYVDYVDLMDLTHKHLRDASKDRFGTLKAEGYESVMDSWINYESEAKTLQLA
jgi:superfamily II DNA or RNA helicase